MWNARVSHGVGPEGDAGWEEDGELAWGRRRAGRQMISTGHLGRAARKVWP